MKGGERLWVVLRMGRIGVLRLDIRGYSIASERSGRIL